jgi:4-hydroxy-3-methylbut-2-enyl diphosphate reductase
MTTKISKATEIGFCFGVKRAIEMLEVAAREDGRLETLGSVVHNEQVMERLSKIGIDVINSPDQIKCSVVSISAHGVSPQVEAELHAKAVKVIDTTCPFVRRAQHAAKKLADDGFFVVVFGDADHPEVKGILGWAQGKGLATLDPRQVENSEGVPRRLGILSQTTQIPENYVEFAKKMIDLALTQDAEIRIIDTICHSTSKRQSDASELAGKVDLMLVIGGKSSANTKRLFELCSAMTETHQIGTEADIDLSWIKGKGTIGITSGTSTSEETIDQVVKWLEKRVS